MKNISALLVVLSLLSFACTDNQVVNPQQNEELRAVKAPASESAGDNILPVTLFDMSDTSYFKLDPATISKVSLDGDIIKIDFTYLKGDKEHTFLLYGSSQVFEYGFPKIMLFLSHDAKEDKGETLTAQTLSFDLKPLKEAIKKVYTGSSITLFVHEPYTNKVFKPYPVLNLQ